MVPIPSQKQIAKIDQITIKKGIPELTLIDIAANRFVYWLMQRVSDYSEVSILCGQGNNGADGFSVAMKLAARGFRVTTIISNLTPKRSNSNTFLYQKLIENRYIRRIYIDHEEDLIKISNSAILVDALFGNGLSRPLTGIFERLIQTVNQRFATIYALDVPSGLLNHALQQSSSTLCKQTFAFQFPRASFFDAEKHKFIGDWFIGKIPLDQGIIDEQDYDTFLTEACDIKSYLPKRRAFDHKGKTGKVLHITNLTEMPGAGILMIKAAIKAGCGLSYVYSIKDSFKVQIPSDSILLRQQNRTEQIDFDAIALGPGLGIDGVAIQCVDFVLSTFGFPMILDADALNIIAKHKWHDRIPPRSILTPHIKEFDRLFGPCEHHFNRVSRQREVSKKWGIYIILKGRYSSVSDPKGNIYYNPTGNPALSRGGSGDVLTGILSALLAQKMPPLDVALCGPYLHGLCADIYIRSEHETGLDMCTLINMIPHARRLLTDDAALLAN